MIKRLIWDIAFLSFASVLHWARLRPSRKSRQGAPQAGSWGEPWCFSAGTCLPSPVGKVWLGASAHLSAPPNGPEGFFLIQYVFLNEGTLEDLGGSLYES